MDTKEFLDSLHNKRRSISDLTRFISSRAAETPNYNLLVGAGCSVSSGIRTGSELIEEWRTSIYTRLQPEDTEPYTTQRAIEYLTRHQGVWYSPATEYSSLFEKHYDLPRQRRMFVEREVSGKFPSIGYLYLIRMVEAGLFQTIFTTNFDDLLNETFYQFSNQRPVVCAHDSTVQSILVTSKRAKIIKLHGDYLFDDIKSTIRETESLEENIKNKLMEFSKDFGLVVIGYGGADRSVMDVLNLMLRGEQYVNSGIYWCLRETDHLHDEVRKMLWRERVYYVPITGFDELMAELYQNELGSQLPIEPTIELGTSQYKLNNMISSLESRAVDHPLLTKHLTELKRERHQNSMYSLLNEISENRSFGINDDDGQTNDVQDDQLQAEMKLIARIKKNEFAEAEKMAKELIADATHAKYRIRLTQKLVTIFKHQEKYEDGIVLCKSLQAEEPENPIHLLSQARLEKEPNTKVSLINQAIELNPKNVNALNLRARVEWDQLIKDPLRPTVVAHQVLETANESIRIDPNPRNPAWEIAMDAAKLLTRNPKDSIETIRGLYDRLMEHDRWSPTVFDYRIELASIDGIDESALKAILGDLEIAYQRTRIGEEQAYCISVLTCLSLLKDCGRILSKFDELDGRFKHRAPYILEKARIQLETLGDLEKALNTLRTGHQLCDEASVTKRLASYLIYAEKYDEAEQLINAIPVHKIGRESQLRIERDIAIGRKNFDQALELQRRLELLIEKCQNCVTERTFILLSAGRYDEAASTVNEYLHSVNFNTDCATEVINYELAKRFQGKNISKTRLNEIVSNASDGLVKFAAYVLLENYDAAFEQLRKAVDRDHSTIYHVRKWPLIKLLSKIPKFGRLLSDYKNFRPPDLQSVENA